jgi:glyoxylase-like metal-dependent hydrolase (beta-lactamase superfamily II)
MTKDAETPHPPATPEFGHVVVGGPTHTYPSSGATDVRVSKFAVGPYDNNVYVVASGGDAIVVDGAAEPDRILREVKGLRVVSIVETHDHPDHTAALRALVEALAVPVLAHPEDPMPVPAEPLAHGDRVRVGDVELTVLHTPGHTPGSLCFLLEPSGAEPHLFTGDTLFPGGPGNTGGGGFERIMRSLDELFELPDATRVSPGHGLDTTIGRERPYLQTWRDRGW